LPVSMTQHAKGLVSGPDGDTPLLQQKRSAGDQIRMHAQTDYLYSPIKTKAAQQKGEE